ncbi:MAG: antibiotic biosynthesis monooxygenase family protein [Anaerolineales bacterium]
MITVIWEYIVKKECVDEFEQIYASNGTWAELFKKGKGYIRTKLIRTPEDPNRFLTVDEWETLEDYKAFLSQWKEDYEMLDKQCVCLTEHESYLGTFGPGLNNQ